MRVRAATLMAGRSVPLAVVLLGLVLLTRAALTVAALQSGYLEYDPDGFSRAVHAYEWMRQPRFEVGVWLPLPFWLTGGLLALWPDLLWAPRALNCTLGLATIVVLFLLGRELGGRQTGLITALLAAVLPWEIWFGASGLAEGLLHFLAAAALLGVVGWRRRGDARWLLAAAAALGLANLVRYEAWFFAAILAAVLVFQALWRRQPRPSHALAFILLVGFPVLWMGLSLAQFGDALAFARMTSDINRGLVPEAPTGLGERLAYYPLAFAGLSWPLLVLALAGVARSALSRRLDPLYLGLVLGELAILSGLTVLYQSIAPGSGRYTVINLLLLLPFAAVAVTFPANAGWPRRLLAAAVIGVVCAHSAVAALSRDNFYPRSATVELARLLRQEIPAMQLSGSDPVPVEIAPPGTPDFDESYALQVLTNRPDVFHFIWEPRAFDQAVLDGGEGPAPRLWISDLRLGHAERPGSAVMVRVGPYGVFYRALVVTPATAPAGSAVSITGRGFEPEEVVGLWFTRTDRTVQALGEHRADAGGRLELTVNLPEDVQAGIWALSAHAFDTGRVSIARFRVE